MPAPLPPPLPRRPAQNVIARHWRGEFSLPRSYWINYLVLGTGVGLAFGVLGAAINLRAGEQPVRWLISLGLTWSAIILFTIWGAIGVWRAATAYRRSGKRFWGAAAKVTMALGALHLVYSLLFVAIPQGLGIYEIVAGDARLASHQFKVLNNGTMLDFSGGISFGTAKEFETMLKAMDNVRTVRLNSNGGRIAEAQKISDLIKARGLSTYVTHQCASACTIMFLGGKQRHLHATRKARLPPALLPRHDRERTAHLDCPRAGAPGEVRPQPRLRRARQRRRPLGHVVSRTERIAARARGDVDLYAAAAEAGGEPPRRRNPLPLRVPCPRCRRRRRPIRALRNKGLRSVR